MSEIFCLLKKELCYVHEGFVSMYVCTAHACTHSAQKNQERMSNPLELESKLPSGCSESGTQPLGPLEKQALVLFETGPM